MNHFQYNAMVFWERGELASIGRLFSYTVHIITTQHTSIHSSNFLSMKITLQKLSNEAASTIFPEFHYFVTDNLFSSRYTCLDATN